MSVQPLPKSAAKTSVFAGSAITIQVLVDAASILANPQAPAKQVIYMTDNNAAGGSTGEGTAELNTACHPGDNIQWRLMSMDPTIPVRFLAMKNASGDVFGFNPPSGSGTLYQGEAVTPANEVYQILILVAGTQTYTWDPFITCR